jgi:hypothetical protein
VSWLQLEPPINLDERKADLLALESEKEVEVGETKEDEQLRFCDNF